MFLETDTDLTLILYIILFTLHSLAKVDLSLIQPLSHLIRFFVNQRPLSLANGSIAKLKALRDELDRDRQRHGPYIQDVVVNYDEKTLV